MTIEQVDVVDAISTRSEDGVVVLTISDHLSWEEKTVHSTALEKKLESYVEFVRSGQLLENYPSARGRGVEIEIILKHSPDKDGQRLLDKAREAIVAAGLEFSYKTLPRGY